MLNFRSSLNRYNGLLLLSISALGACASLPENYHALEIDSRTVVVPNGFKGSVISTRGEQWQVPRTDSWLTAFRNDSPGVPWLYFESEKGHEVLVENTTPTTLAKSQAGRLNDRFKLFCENSKPRRAMSENIRFLVPEVADQMPVDAVANYNKKIRQYGRERIAEFFKQAAMIQANSPYNFYGIYSPILRSSETTLEKAVRPNKLDTYAFKSAMGGSNRLESEGQFYFISTLNKQNARRTYLSYVIADVHEYANVLDLEPRLSKAYQQRIPSYNPGAILVASEIDIDGKRIFPLADSPYLSLSEFRHQFTFLIPENIQKRMQTESGGKWHPAAVKDGKPNISEAVSEADYIWDQYFKTFTSVQEAQSESANAIDYKVSLDLTVFCKYGQRVDDLQSK